MVAPEVRRPPQGGGGSDGVAGVLWARLDDEEDREPVAKREEGHPQARHAAVAVGEGVDAHPLAMDRGAE